MYIRRPYAWRMIANIYLEEGDRDKGNFQKDYDGILEVGLMSS